MKVISTAIADVLLIEPVLFTDDRGYFFEAYHARQFKEIGITRPFVQDNQSYSVQHTLRGLHYQKAPYAQAKLIRVLEGSIYDVAVDIRPSSPTYKHYVALELKASTHQMIYIPEGFAHGFYVTSSYATVLYKCSRPYSPQHENHIRYDDPNLAIDWKLQGSPILSAKDLLPHFLE